MFVDIERGRRLPSEPLVRAYEKHFGLAPGSLAGLRQRALVERADQVTGERLRSFAAAPGGPGSQPPAVRPAGPAATRPGRGRAWGFDRTLVFMVRVVDAALDLVWELCGGQDFPQRVIERTSSGV
jgi:hypothetical protein